MVLMFVISSAFSGNSGNERDDAHVAKQGPVLQSKTILLKKPFPKDEYLQTYKEKTAQMLTEYVNKENERLAEHNMSFPHDASSLLDPYIWAAESSWDTTHTVYSILTPINDDSDLLQMMTTLQKCYKICTANIASQWLNGVKFGEHVNTFGASIAISCVTSMYESNFAYHNMEQVMETITSRVKPLNKEKYANTIKLFSILSKYKKDTTAPSGTLVDYTNNFAAYQEEFTQTLSLAELEW